MPLKALVTGSAGFVGRHISAELISRGWEVEGWDIAEGSDARILFAAERHFTAYDLIVHCAFHVGGRAAIDGDPTAFAKNLELDAAMFGWAVRTRQKHVLYFSSSAAYPVDLQTEAHYTYAKSFHQDSRLMEDHIRRGAYSPWPDARYGWAKLTGEELAKAARESGLGVTVVRPFSGYGADQSLEYPFPKIIERVKAWKPRETLKVFGDPKSTRDWIHIEDLTRIALAVVEFDQSAARSGDVSIANMAGTPVNLCTGMATSFRDLILMAWSLAYSGSGEHQPEVESIPGPMGVMHRVGNPTRMLVHGTPTISIEEGVRRALSQ